MMDNKIDYAMIFAAGFGKRMHPLTSKIPKPLAMVGNQSLLEIAINKVKEVGISNIIVNCHYKHQMIKDALQEHPDVIIAYEEDILETGGALVDVAQKYIKAQHCITINVDSVWTDPIKNQITSLGAMINKWNPATMDILMMVQKKEDFYGYHGPGDFWLTPEGQLNRSGERTHAYIGAQIINLDIVKTIHKKHFSLSEVYENQANKDGLLQRSFGFEQLQPAFHVGDIDALDEINKLLEKKIITI